MRLWKKIFSPRKRWTDRDDIKISNTFTLYKTILSALRYQASGGMNHFTWYDFCKENPVHISIKDRLDKRGFRLNDKLISKALCIFWNLRHPNTLKYNSGGI
jgi:hypothetical protein